MAVFSTFRYLIVLPLLALYFKTLTADSNSSFWFESFNEDAHIESQLALYGDARIVNDGSFVEITGSSVSSAGRLIYRKPIKLLERNPTRVLSFSTYFSFSMSPDRGDGLTFFMVPVGFPVNVFDGGSFRLLAKKKLGVLAVEFDTSKDQKYGDVSSFISVKVSNASSINLMLNSGEKLQAWIDYVAVSKRLEARLSKLGHMRPADPMLSYAIDLSKMWNEGVLVGVSSSKGNSSQICKLYSWSFKPRQVPHWMHSQPLDPEAFTEKVEGPSIHKRSDCLLKILAALILGTACGALGAFFVLFVWTILGNMRPVVPEECVVHPVEFEYETFKVVVDKAIENGKI